MQYSVSCVKYDRHGYKPRKRVLLMTDKVSRNSLNIIMEDLICFFFQECYLLEPGSFKVKEHFEYSRMHALSLSNLGDGIIVIRLPVDAEDSKVREEEKFIIGFPLSLSLSLPNRVISFWILMFMSLKQLLKLPILPIKRRKYNLRHQEGTASD